MESVACRFLCTPPESVRTSFVSSSSRRKLRYSRDSISTCFSPRILGLRAAPWPLDKWSRRLEGHALFCTISRPLMTCARIALHHTTNIVWHYRTARANAEVQLLFFSDLHEVFVSDYFYLQANLFRGVDLRIGARIVRGINNISCFHNKNYDHFTPICHEKLFHAPSKSA